MSQDPEEKVAFVKDQLRKVTGARHGSSYTMVKCPWHSDNSPSLRVSHNLRYPGSIGWTKCYACGANEPWNEYASTTGLQGFDNKKSDKIPSTSFDLYDADLLEDTAVELGTEPLKYYDLLTNAYMLGLEDRWRGFKLTFLAKLGCKIAYHKDKERYFVWIPVNVNHQLVGYVKAYPQKSVDRSYPSYLNAPGFWSKNKGLLMFDQSSKLMRDRGLKTVVLVEGPRDALRLLLAGIPAIAILGTQSWSSEKIFLLQQHGAERFVLCTDGDDAGKAAADLMVTGNRVNNQGEVIRVAVPLPEAVDEVKVFKLWEYEGDYDPCKMPFPLLNKLRKLIV